MNLFDHPIWLHVRPYARLSPGRDNLDFLQLPDQLRELALGVVANCVACGAPIQPMRARAKSERSRVAGTETERRLFYAPTCPTDVNPGCSRTRAAQRHKDSLRSRIGEMMQTMKEAMQDGEARVGDWLLTSTGRQFWPMDPRAEEIHIDDVAHHLALQCRFTGACRKFYSVAEHSVRVSRIVPPEHALWGLLHDASEAYLVDLPRPIKRDSEIGKHYKIAEARVMLAVCERFDLSSEMPHEVHVADNIMLMTEKRDIMPMSPWPWPETNAPLEERIEPWTPEVAELRFLMAFKQLTEGRR